MKNKKRSRKMPKVDKRLSRTVYDFSNKDKFYAWFFFLTSLLLAIAILYIGITHQEDVRPVFPAIRDIPCNAENVGYAWLGSNREIEICMKLHEPKLPLVDISNLSTSNFYGKLDLSYTEDRYRHNTLWMTLADNNTITGFACNVPIINDNYTLNGCPYYVNQIWDQIDKTKNISYIDCDLRIDNQDYSVFWANCDAK